MAVPKAKISPTPGTDASSPATAAVFTTVFAAILAAASSAVSATPAPAPAASPPAPAAFPAAGKPNLSNADVPCLIACGTATCANCDNL